MANNVSIEDVPLNGFHQLLCIRSGGGWLLDGYVLSIIGVAMVPLAAALGLSGFWQGMVAASALIGIFCGGFLGGVLTGRLGRKTLYFVGPTIFVLCSLAQYWATSGAELFFMRFLIGIGVGFEYPVAGALLVEFLPKKYRGPRLAMLTILWFAGAALAYIVGNALLDTGRADAWRIVLASPAVIGVLLLAVRLGTPESPRWLLSKGRAAEAERIIRQVYGPAFSLCNLPEQVAEKKVSLLALLHSGYGKRMLFVAVFWSCSVIPVFAVYAFAPTVLQALNLRGAWASYGSVAITMLFVVGCIVATRLINIMGRRSMLIHSFLWSGLALLALGACSDGNQMLVLVLFGAYALFIGGAQVLQLVYPNELFPTEIRSAAVGMGASLSRIGAAIGTWLVPISLQTIGIGHTMYAAAGVTLVGLLVSLALAPETRFLSLQEAASLGR
ncbi:MFS transporter [Cupriavidus taiwanensis]|uniref:MFS transporter n=1 Tax=Cupriavidus taiwanensis TaxID=164546 RepID=UPI000E109D04|nr:MFS transporter [Cupriavidus taiwanensis]SOY70574.1 putative metabolite transporter, MFS superfamily [Cupriavidus taiwanensis]SOY72184.1 putative metabolite transporter, MFS superfamily [Cupriavidus taiwanensis]SOY95750.1 putative metabolite transporter, MFS superfamily [Cupriavidus taiwanensis]SOZ74962.1 putative metabolite transporter, MFS superfamily [Cupriavidus taiwanensis]SOZ88496.1 putative metabolite transporter, MFS superfamily [Cupriavidus taiwanensis]